MSKLGADTYLLNKEFPEYPVGTLWQDIPSSDNNGYVNFYTKTEQGWVFAYKGKPLFFYQARDEQSSNKSLQQ